MSDIDRIDRVFQGVIITLVCVFVVILFSGFAYQSGKDSVQSEAVHYGYGEIIDANGHRLFRWVKQ